MNLFLPKKPKNIRGQISITGSKSESNRLLVLNALFAHPIELFNSSQSADTLVLKHALSTSEEVIDVHHAGTAMRFLTAYFAIQEGRKVILTGSDRMKQRPIGILVAALRQLGAEIHYLEKEGFPPLAIHGKKMPQNQVKVSAEISSQYITALLLIGAKLPHGLTIELTGEITSLPYLMMTVDLLRKVGIVVAQQGNIFQVHPTSFLPSQSHTVESDWSSASYYYGLAAVADSAQLTLDSFQAESLQGDAALVEIYAQHFGVQSAFNHDQLTLYKSLDFQPENSTISIDLNATPDIAQTLAVTCALLKKKCHFTGLATLRIKETDRLLALQNELKKIGAIAEITVDSLAIVSFEKMTEKPVIATYQDHRMAMSFAPAALYTDLEIIHPEVVEKSYPTFWEDFSGLTFV